MLRARLVMAWEDITDAVNASTWPGASTASWLKALCVVQKKKKRKKEDILRGRIWCKSGREHEHVVLVK